MANSYTQLYLHIVFGVKNRASVIKAEWRGSLYMYIGGIIRNTKSASLTVGGIEDHVHILASMNKNLTVPGFVSKIKTGSTLWVNNNGFFRGHFEWQDGYGAFSVSPSLVERTQQYIANQEFHHKKMCYREEFEEMLKRHGICYDSRYLPEPIDDE